MGAPYFYLRDDERVVQKLRAAPTYALVLLSAPLLALSILLAVALVARAFFAPLSTVPTWMPWTAWGALAGIAALVAWRRAATTEYALTDQRIYTRVGKLVTRLHFTTHDKITDIRFRQGPLERAFGLASLTFATAGGDVHVAGVRDAMGVKAAAERARDAFVRALLAEAPAGGAHVRDTWETRESHVSAAAPAPAPAPPLPEYTGPRPDYLQAGDAPVWSARPRPIAAVGALRSLLGIIPVLLFSNFMRGPQRAFILLGALGLVLIFVAVRLMQLRRTEYIATDRRVYSRSGLVGTTVNQLTYDKITDITFHQDLLGRLFGYGSVTVQTAGSSQAPITMVGLGAPLDAKETIEKWRDTSLEARR